MMQFDFFSASHLAVIEPQPFQEDFEPTPSFLAAAVAGIANTARNDGQVVACFGVARTPRPGALALWSVIDRRMPTRGWVPLVRRMRLFVERAPQYFSARHIEGSVHEDFEQGHRLARILEFRPVCRVSGYVLYARHYGAPMLDVVA